MSTQVKRLHLDEEEETQAASIPTDLGQEQPQVSLHQPPPQEETPPTTTIQPQGPQHKIDKVDDDDGNPIELILEEFNLNKLPIQDEPYPLISREEFKQVALMLLPIDIFTNTTIMPWLINLIQMPLPIEHAQPCRYVDALCVGLVLAPCQLSEKAHLLRRLEAKIAENETSMSDWLLKTGLLDAILLLAHTESDEIYTECCRVLATHCSSLDLSQSAISNQTLTLLELLIKKPIKAATTTNATHAANVHATALAAAGRRQAHVINALACVANESDATAHAFGGNAFIVKLVMYTIPEPFAVLTSEHAEARAHLLASITKSQGGLQMIFSENNNAEILEFICWIISSGSSRAAVFGLTFLSNVVKEKKATSEMFGDVRIAQSLARAAVEPGAWEEMSAASQMQLMAVRLLLQLSPHHCNIQAVLANEPPLVSAGLNLLKRRQFEEENWEQVAMTGIEFLLKLADVSNQNKGWPGSQREALREAAFVGESSSNLELQIEALKLINLVLECDLLAKDAAEQSPDIATSLLCWPVSMVQDDEITYGISLSVRIALMQSTATMLSKGAADHVTKYPNAVAKLVAAVMELIQDDGFQMQDYALTEETATNLARRSELRDASIACLCLLIENISVPGRGLFLHLNDVAHALAQVAGDKKCVSNLERLRAANELWLLSLLLFSGGGALDHAFGVNGGENSSSSLGKGGDDGNNKVQKAGEEEEEPGRKMDFVVDAWKLASGNLPIVMECTEDRLMEEADPRTLFIAMAFANFAASAQRPQFRGFWASGLARPSTSKNWEYTPSSSLL